MQRKKQEQEKAESAVLQATRERRLMMLQELVKIRKSFFDVARIDLGERFEITLGEDDLHGWPRLTLRLSDHVLPKKKYASLRISANDWHSRGNIEISYGDPEKTETISLANEAELLRLSLTLKKCVRSYLDDVGDIVLEAERKPDLDAEDDPRLEKDSELYGDGGKESSKDDRKALSDDVFTETGEQDALDTLPTIDDVEVLPGLD